MKTINLKDIRVNITHKIKIDENINLNINIPKEINVEEFRVLFDKTNRLIRSVAVFDIQDITNKTNKPSYQRIGRKINRWTEEEIKLLKTEYSYKSMNELSQKVNHSAGSIYQKSKELGLKKNGHIRNVSSNKTNFSNKHNWTQKEVNYIKDNYGKIKTGLIGEKLGLTGKQVIDKYKYQEKKGTWIVK